MTPDEIVWRQQAVLAEAKAGANDVARVQAQKEAKAWCDATAKANGREREANRTIKLLTQTITDMSKELADAKARLEGTEKPTGASSEEEIPVVSGDVPSKYQYHQVQTEWGGWWAKSHPAGTKVYVRGEMGSQVSGAIIRVLKSLDPKQSAGPFQYIVYLFSTGVKGGEYITSDDVENESGYRWLKGGPIKSERFDGD